VRCPAVRFELFVLACLASAPACLPSGEPPTGRQVWAGRDRLLEGILPARSPDDGVTRILARQTGPDLGSGSSVALISVTPSGAISDQPLVDRWTCHPVLGCIDVDHRGRLFVWSAPTEQSADVYSSPLLSRIDLDSGERLDFGAVFTYAFSPSHQRAVVSRGPGSDSGDTVLLEADDGAPTALSGAIDPTFVGEDLYFVDEGRVLQRLPVAGTLEVVRRGVNSFSVSSTAQGPRLLLRLSSPGMSMPGPSVLLNPATGEERQLRASSSGIREPLVSPDGQWVWLPDVDVTSRRKFSLLEVATGMEEPFELPVEVSEPEWRPNHAELWFSALRTGPGSWRVFVKRPHEPLEEVEETLQPIVVPDVSFRTSSLFTTDGAHLFSVEPTDQQNARLFVGDADHPSGPRFPLNPPGTRFLRRDELSDGRLVAQSFYRGPDRNDIYLVDPRDGATRLLARDGVTMALGRSRVAALSHRIDQRGDLEVIDLDSGQATPLAREFVTFGYVQARFGDPDQARPAAPVVFQFRARFASPHDGLWLATLP
jgi:hypothetical protein